MARPSVDVVVPYAGSTEGLAAVVDRMGALALSAGDTVTVVDNRGVTAPAARTGAPRVVAATRRRGSYHARNRGAALGTAPWLVFLDGDVEPPADLLERYFDPAPGEEVGVLAGAVVDVPPGPGSGSIAERFAWLKRSMSQEVTLGHGRWAFAQTANCAVRRAAFEAVGGFADAVRSGGDADLCWRLGAAGWRLERRDGAWVVHHNRTTVPRMLAQRARHGAGAAWLASRWPGALPRRRWPGLALWAARRAGAGVAALARGERDEAIVGLLDGPAVWAFELGRLLPNRHLR